MVRRAWIRARGMTHEASKVAGARRLLAFDAAGSACSAALWSDGAVQARRFETMTRGHSERLVPMIEDVMAEAGCDYGSLGAIAVTCGPGGFTGVRIGLATARGLALARGLPVVGIDNFEAIAAGIPPGERAGRTIAVLLNAKRAEFFLQLFSAALEPLGAPLCVSPAALERALPSAPLLFAGDAVAQGLGGLADPAGRDLKVCQASTHADAGVVARLAADRPLPEAGAVPSPLYLRPPDVSLPRPSRGAPK